MCMSNTNMPLKCHIWQLVHVYIWDNYVSVYMLQCSRWTHCNQQCDQEHWYTYNSYYWHMPLNKCASHITHMSYCNTALSAYRLNFTAQTNKKCSCYLPSYNHECASNKCAPHMPHMPNTSCLYVYFSIHPSIYIIHNDDSQNRTLVHSP